MVASLQSRRDTLEAMLRDKTLELKQLCIQEAELTGVLPPETPMAPGERPPIFSRQVDIRYINTLKANAETSWFQRGSPTLQAYNSIRRTTRTEYSHDLQSSAEYESNIFKQVYMNKAQPSYVQHTYEPAGNWNRNQWYRHSVGHSKGYDFSTRHQNSRQSKAPSQLTSHCYGTLPKDNRLKSKSDSLNRGHRLHIGCTSSGDHFESVGHQTLAPTNGRATRHESLSISSPIQLDTSDSAFYQMYPEPSVVSSMPPFGTPTLCSRGAKHSSSQSLNLCSIPEKGPSQFRFNSLGRKKPTKEWRETSLDTADSCRQRQLPHSSLRTPIIPESASFQRLLSRHRLQSFTEPLQSTSDFTAASSARQESISPAQLATQMEANVPLESPKNHMVVEAGTWKPYRESTKPFEMSDFYKYSTKFKKNKE